MLKEHQHTFCLAAGECNPEGEMPLGMLMNRIIEMATAHANKWGVGYERLIKDNHAWVLSRVAIEATRYPRVNEQYTIVTWIEGYNRYFSQRNFELLDADGNTLGFARTIWMVIDLTTRQGVNIAELQYISQNVSPRPCPIEPATKMAAVAPTRSATHDFVYSDCDFNRHVNTVRYIDLLMNQFSMDTHDQMQVRRLEMAFVSESYYGQQATVLVDDHDMADCRAEIAVDGKAHVRARLMFAPRTVTTQ